MQKCFIYFFLLATCSFSNCFSMEADYNENSESSIQKIVDNKVYLKPGSIQIAQNGIFINLEGELLAIDHLESDQEGVYFEPRKLKIKYCENCEWPLVWGKCLNPGCKKKKKEKEKEQE